MGSYKYGKQAVASKEQSRVRTWWRVSAITLLLMIPFVIYIVVTTLPPSPVTGRTIDKGSYDPFTVVKTSWFSFKVEKTWQSVPELTKENEVYTYREMQGPNPQGLMQIYINSQPKANEAYFSRVVPVSVEQGNSFFPKSMQPDCTSTTTDKLVQNSFPTTQAGTSFICWAGSSILYAVAGEVGGDTSITMKRQDGSTANYTITYRNLAFLADENTFPRVLSTFKAL